MIPPLRPLLDEFEALERQLADPSSPPTPNALARRAPLRRAAPRRRAGAALERQEAARADARAALDDPELGDIARDELADARARIEALGEELRDALLPRDPDDDKDVILEVRAAAGGDEASLFAAELLQAYLRYAAAEGPAHRGARQPPHRGRRALAGRPRSRAPAPTRASSSSRASTASSASPPPRRRGASTPAP
jgi:peptide chain release factor 1